MNTWQLLLRQLKKRGYAGADDDLGAVVKFCADENISPNLNEKDLDLHAEHAKAYPPKASFSLDDEARSAEAEDRIVARLADAMKGLSPKAGEDAGKKSHEVEVKHVKDRVADDPKGGFAHAGEFYRDVATVGKSIATGAPVISDKLKAWAGATLKATLSTYGSEGVGADGGFAVPPEHRTMIETIVMGEESILAMCDQIPLSRSSMTFPDDEDTPWSSSGILGYWEGEAGAITQSKPVLTEKTLALRKLTALVPVTDELLEDAVAMGSYVTSKAATKLDFAMGEGIFRGTGVGQPLGFLNASSLISITKETNQGAATISAANIFKMWARMYGPYRRRAVWFINQDIEPQLFSMGIPGRKNSGGATTNFGAVAYLPANGMSDSPFGTLMGRPVIPTQHCETLGDLGDIVLACMPEYRAAVKSSGLQAATSIHLWFDQSVTAFRFVIRMDGAPRLSAAFSPRDGTNTMSAFVALAARA